MEVRGRDDRLARAKRVGERPAGDLIRVQIRRHVYVGREQVVHDRPLGEVLVHKGDVVGHPELFDGPLQGVAILLAPLLQQLRVGLANDQVERVWMLGDDRRHRSDHVLETLPGIDQAEGRHDRVVGHVEPAFQGVASARFDRRHAVRDDDGRLPDAVVGLEEPGCGVGHHDELIAVLRDRTDGVAHRR